MSGKRVLERGESTASGYDLNLNEYATNNYKEKLESDHRKMSHSSNIPPPSSQLPEDGFEDDEYFAETGSYLPSSSQYPSQDTPWMKVFDDVSGSYYYFNTITGESTWEKPSDFIDEPVNDERINQQQLIDESMTLFPEVRQPSEQPSDQYDFSWNDISLQHIQQNWNPQSDDHQVTDTAPASFQMNQPRVNGLDSVDDHHQHFDMEGEEQSDLQLPRETNIMSKAYGTLYGSQQLIVDEKTAIQNKFLKMKKGGTLLRELMGWEEWLSPQGALFYLKKGRYR